ncbi:MAG: helix-turn-helix domain-containing protein [Anaerolineales bacterium]|nr:helix-turn-helix domain-containing protein [Chloroflexota bacterium]MBL6982735.1 helix-turn-helix domain-containing protein [Anaerolineales bacterium]
MNFGSRVRQLRVEKDISLRDFAEMIGIDFTYLSKIENGKVDPPSEEKIRMIARELGEDEEEMLSLAGKFSSEQMRKAVEEHPEVGKLLRRIQSRKLTRKQLKQMLDITSDEESPGEEPK